MALMSDPKIRDEVPGAPAPAPTPPPAPGTDPATPTFPSDERIAADPRLGVSPQGTYGFDKMTRMFPEMFPWFSDNILAPEEQAKKDAGLSYDKTKKFVPAPRSQVQEPDPMDRNRFEQEVFNQLGGNPFMMDPYQEVIRADAQLPELFNHVFQGHAVWSDLPRLSKEQREFWEDVKKQHHARVYEQAKSTKQQMMQGYQWMMTKFDMERKEEFAQQAQAEKKRADYEASKMKEPPSKNLINEQGIETLHHYVDGGYVDTGHRTGTYSLEQHMPPDVRFAYSIVNKYSSEVPKELMMMAMFAKDTAMLERLQKAYAREVPPSEKELYEVSSRRLAQWASEKAKSMEAEEKKALAASGPAPAGPGTGAPPMAPMAPTGSPKTTHIYDHTKGEAVQIK